MSFLPAIVICLAGFAAGVGIGFVLRPVDVGGWAGLGGGGREGERVVGTLTAMAQGGGGRDAVSSDTAARLGRLRAVKHDTLFAELRDLFRFVRAADVEELPELLRQLETLPGYQREIVGKTLLRRFVKEDPFAAIAAFAAVKGRDQIDSEIIRAAAELDSAAALGAVQGLPMSRHKAAELSLAFGGAVTASPEVALAWLDSLADGEQRIGLLREHFPKLLVSDPAAAVREMNLVRPGDAGSDDSWNLREGFFEFAKTDPEGAIAGASRITERSRRRDALAGVGSAWAAQDAAAARAWAEGLPPGERSAALAAITATQAQADPAAALLVSQEIVNLSDRRGAVGTAASAWFAADASGSVEWMHDNLSSTARRNAYADIVSGYDGHNADPQRLLGLLPELDPIGQPVRRFARHWARSAPEDAVAYYNTLEGGPLRASFEQELRRSWRTRRMLEERQ